MQGPVAVLADRHAETLTRIEAAIVRETPAYEQLAGAAARAEWEEGIDRTLRLFVALRTEGRDTTDAEVDEVRRIGRRRADEDFPLDAVNNSVRVAVHVAYEVVAEAAPDERPEVLRDFAWDLIRFGNLITSLIVGGYTERRQELAASTERGRAQLLDDLLVGNVPDDILVEQGKALDVDLSGLLGFFLVPATGMHALEAEVRALLPGGFGGSMASGPAAHTALVVPVTSAPKWEEACRVVAACANGYPVAVLAVGPCSGLAELRERYEEAVEVLPHMPLPADGRTLLRCRDMRMAQLVVTASPAALRNAVRAVMGPLAARPARTEELVDTLVALVRYDFGIKEAARVLRRTPRTVRRRMGVIQDTTGLAFSGWEGPIAYALFVHADKVSSEGHFRGGNVP